MDLQFQKIICIKHIMYWHFEIFVSNFGMCIFVFRSTQNRIVKLIGWTSYNLITNSEFRFQLVNSFDIEINLLTDMYLNNNGIISHLFKDYSEAKKCKMSIPCKCDKWRCASTLLSWIQILGNFNTYSNCTERKLFHLKKIFWPDFS